MLPLVLAVVFGTIQLAIWHHAVNTAHAAAAACVERARGYDSTAADGEATARRLLAQVRGLDAPTVAAIDDGREVRCVVGGRAPVLLAWGVGPISEAASLPKERLS